MNNSDVLKSYVQANATFYDKQGTIVGTGMGNTTNLAPHSKRTIDVIGMGVEHSSRYEVELEEM